MHCFKETEFRHFTGTLIRVCHLSVLFSFNKECAVDLKDGKLQLITSSNKLKGVINPVDQES